MPKDKKKAKERRETREENLYPVRDSLPEPDVDIEFELVEDTEARLEPRPYVGKQIVYAKECRNCKAEFSGSALSEAVWVECPACGDAMPLEPSDYMRHINVWSLTPKGERLGPVEDD